MANQQMKPSEWIDARAEFLFKKSQLANVKFCAPFQMREQATIDYLDAVKPRPEVSHDPDEVGMAK